MTEERERMLKLSCYFPSLGPRNAQTFFPSHVTGNSPEARAERPAIDPERSCSTDYAFYSNHSIARKWARQSEHILGCTLDTQPGRRWKKPAPRAAYR